MLLRSICQEFCTGTGYITLMPVFAKDVYHGGPQSLGLLLGAAGAGALFGALRLAQRSRSAGLEREIVWAGLIAAAGLIVFSYMTSVTAALLILPTVGFGITTLAAGCNTVIQLVVPDRLHGRVMALFAVLFVGHTAAPSATCSPAPWRRSWERRRPCCWPSPSASA